ncbi:unnamed protein product, partial [Ixodes pacificus]
MPKLNAKDGRKSRPEATAILTQFAGQRGSWVCSCAPHPASLAISLSQLPQRGFARHARRGLQRGWVVSRIRRCVYVCVCFGSACSVCSGTQQLRPDGIRDGV